MLMITSEQRSKIDHASEEELWRQLSATLPEGSEAAYIRERLVRKAQSENQRQIEDLTARMKAVEQKLERSQLGTPTFWLALLAAGFASFSVPWPQVQATVTAWGQQIQKALEAPPNKRSYYREREQAWRSSVSTPVVAENRPVTESDLLRQGYTAPVNPTLPTSEESSPLSDALLLLPKPNGL